MKNLNQATVGKYRRALTKMLNAQDTLQRAATQADKIAAVRQVERQRRRVLAKLQTAQR